MTNPMCTTHRLRQICYVSIIKTPLSLCHVLAPWKPKTLIATAGNLGHAKNCAWEMYHWPYCPPRIIRYQKTSVTISHFIGLGKANPMPPPRSNGVMVSRNHARPVTSSVGSRCSEPITGVYSQYGIICAGAVRGPELMRGRWLLTPCRGIASDFRLGS